MTIAIAIAGVADPLIPFESLDITEALSMPGPSPATMAVTLIDRANAYEIADLADVVVTDGAEVLFRGQVLDVETWPVANYRRHRVTCGDYSRLVTGTQVYAGGSDLAAYRAGQWSRAGGTAPVSVNDPLDGSGVTDTEWVGRYQGTVADVFRAVVRRWFTYQGRDTFAVPVTRNVATLAAPLGWNPYLDVTVVVTDGDALPATGEYVLTIDAERMLVTGGQGTATLTVTRAFDDTNAVEYDAGATAYGPLFDDTTYVGDFGWLPVGGLAWLDTTLDTVLSDLATCAGAGVYWWLDYDFCWHLGSFPGGPVATWGGAVTGEALARGMPYAPLPASAYSFAGLSDAPDMLTAFPTHELRLRRDATPVVSRVYSRTRTAPSSGWIANGDGTALAPQIVVSDPSATVAAMGIAQAELVARAAGAQTLTFYTLGGSGWHRGQVVKITNATLGLSAAPYVIRQLRLSVFTADGQRRYDFEVGDQRSTLLTRSLSGTRSADRPRGVEQTPAEVEVAKLKDAGARWTVLPLWDAQPKAGTEQYIGIQLSTATGEPMKVYGISVNWHLWKNDDDIGAGSTALGSYLKYPGTSTDANGQAWNIWGITDTATADDWFDVTVEASA